MQDKTREAIINKEIETYRKFAVVLESLKPIIMAWDGKCFNKKIVQELDDFLKYGKSERSYYIGAGINTRSYGNYFDISIKCYDDIVKTEPNINGYIASYQINNSDCFLRMKVEDVTTKTDTGKYRIKADGFIAQFDEKIKYLNDKAVELEKDLYVVESMKADIEQIKHLMDIFSGKYSERMKEVYNCKYRLKDCSGTQYR